MKVVCDACGTRYSVDESRVAGKAFKFRCKRCDHVVVQRAATAPVPGAVPDAGVWYVVVEGTQRQVTASEVQQLRAVDALNDATLVWREGFEDWRALGTVEELREVAASSIEVVPDPAAQPVRVLRNERNESSLLFTLGSLQKLAAPAPAGAPNGKEGSGLLDIRAIARTLAAPSGRTREPGAERGGHRAAERGSIDDLPVYGPVSFGEPAVLIPNVRSSRRADRRLVWALAASVGALAIVTTILAVVIVRGGGPAHASGLPRRPATPPGTLAARPGPAGSEIASPAPAPAAPPATAITPLSASPAHPTDRAVAAPPADPGVLAPRSADPAVVDPTAHADTAAHAEPAHPASAAHAEPVHPASAARAEPGHPATAAHAEPPARPSSADEHRSPGRPSSGPSPVAPAAAAALAPAHPDDACSEVTCIVNGYADACCRIYRDAGHRSASAASAAPTTSAASTAQPDPAQPENLDRQAIAAGLSRIDTSACRDRSQAHGIVSVSIKVSAAGAVTAVTVKSSPDPALSACVTAAAREGSFARTQRGASFSYVWRF